MKKNVSKILMATAASSAAPFAVSQANAQDLDIGQQAIDYRINLAFEGGALLFNDNEDDDKLGGSDKLGTDHNAYGAISYTKMIDDGLDWRLSGAAHFVNNSDSELYFNEGTNSATFGSNSHFNYQTLDFDLGKRVKAGEVDLRLFAGLRAVHSRESLEYGIDTLDTSDGKVGQLDKLGSSRFIGVGPRIGVEAHYDMGQNWGLVGGASAAAMWGQRRESLDFSVFENDPGDIPPISTTSFSQTNTSTEVVTNFSINGGLAWEFQPGKTVTGGYRLEQWRNLRSFSDDSFTAHGPFIKLDVKM